MSSSKRYVVVGFLTLALAFGLTAARGLEHLWESLGWDNPGFFGSQELNLTFLLSIALAALAAIVCLRHETIFRLGVEVVDELIKVTWPSREDTSHATVVVIVTVLICSAFLGVFDAFWGWVTTWLLTGGPGVSAS